MKCPGHYCIPVRSVCDGIKDLAEAKECPYSDVLVHVSHSISGDFDCPANHMKCPGHYCIPVRSVCDDIPQRQSVLQAFPRPSSLVGWVVSIEV